jgi:serine protease
VTYDGRTPTTDDFDDSSTTPDADEQIVADLDGGTEIGILVDRYSGWGNYELSVEELGR